MRLTIISINRQHGLLLHRLEMKRLSCRSVNHPLGLNQALVCAGEGAMAKHDQTPIVKVRMLS
jgi:hypothetical protein